MVDKEVNGVKLEKIPITFQLNEKVLIDGAVIRPINFKAYAEVVAEANSSKLPALWDTRMRRLRMVRQVQYYSNGTVVPVGTEDIPHLLIPDARAIISKLDADGAKSGKIIRDGDGISKSIVYGLGTVIPTGKDKPPIAELEFAAKTYGDIEDVMAADNPVAQTVQLITLLGKPTVGTLLQLPSWAVDQITMADGVTIMREVLPRFLGSPDE